MRILSSNDYNYRLRKSQFVVIHDDFEKLFPSPFYTFIDMKTIRVPSTKEDAQEGETMLATEITFIREGSEEEDTMLLEVNQIMIIYKEATPKFAVFYD